MQTNQATHPQNVQTNPVTSVPPSGAPKSLGTGSSPKALGGGGDPALAQWYEQAYAYYNQVQSGQAQMPDQAAWNEFLNQMNWAYQTLNGGGAMPPMGNPAQGPGSGMPQEMHYDYESNEITATGEPITHRSWGIDETLIIPSMAAQVEYIWTTDNSVTPAQQVLKVKITNEITGTEEIVTYENADDPDFSLTIKAADEKSVTGNDPKVSVEKYDMNSAEGSEGAGGTASVPGELNEDGIWEYFGEGESTIHFEPVGDPESKQEHVFYGYVNLNLPGGSTIDYSMEDDDIVGVIKNHKGEVTDTIRIKKGYTVDTQGHPEYILFKDDATGEFKSFEELGGVPEEFGDRILVGGEDTSAQKAEEVAAFVEDLGYSEEEILDALSEAGYEISSIEELAGAMEDGTFPPEEPDYQFFAFLHHLDSELTDLNQQIQEANDAEDWSLVNSLKEEYFGKIADILGGFYGDELSLDSDHDGVIIDGVKHFFDIESDGMPKAVTKLDGNKIYKDTGDGWEHTSTVD